MPIKRLFLLRCENTRLRHTLQERSSTPRTAPCSRLEPSPRGTGAASVQTPESPAQPVLRQRLRCAGPAGPDLEDSDRAPRQAGTRGAARCGGGSPASRSQREAKWRLWLRGDSAARVSAAAASTARGGQGAARPRCAQGPRRSMAPAAAAAAAAARPAQRPAAPGALPIRPARPHRLSVRSLGARGAHRRATPPAAPRPFVTPTQSLAAAHAALQSGRAAGAGGCWGAGAPRVPRRLSVRSGPDVDPLLLSRHLTSAQAGGRRPRTGCRDGRAGRGVARGAPGPRGRFPEPGRFQRPGLRAICDPHILSPHIPAKLY